MGRRTVPQFKSDEEAAEFWDTHSLADYIRDTDPVDDVQFAMRPLKQISLRLAPGQIQQLKRIAAAKGIGYQTMLRMWITERARQESRALHS